MSNTGQKQEDKTVCVCVEEGGGGGRRGERVLVTLAASAQLTDSGNKGEGGGGRLFPIMWTSTRSKQRARIQSARGKAGELP